MTGSFISDLKISLKAVWIILSFVTLAVLYLSFFQPEILLNTAPVCLSKAVTGNECFMCGTTRAFTELAEGNLKKASVLNYYGVFIFTGFLLNGIFFIYFLITLSSKLFIRKCEHFSKSNIFSFNK